jgi:hypothetical protein
MDGDQVPIGSSRFSARSRRLGLAGGVLAAGLVLATASGAQAKDEFEDGFKIELGRIAAHEAVHAGKHILGGVFHDHGDHGGYQGGYGYPAYGHGYGHGGNHYRHHRGHHWKHHRHHRGCGHHSSTHVYYVPVPAPYYYESHTTTVYGYPPGGHPGGWQPVDWEDDD